MNGKLIFLLSLFGLAMAVGTVSVIPSKIEGVLWLPIFVTIALLVARRAPGQFFMHGFLIGLTNWVWVAAAHVILRDPYMAHHAKEAAAFQATPLPSVMKRFDLPIPGLSGIIIGSLSWIASKFAAPKRTAPGS